MEIEWSRSVDGKLDIERLVAAMREAAAPVGIRQVRWEFRRAAIQRDDLTYKCDNTDDRDEVLALYAQPIASAQATLSMFEEETREPVAMVHLGYDGTRTRVRVESGSLRYVERLRDRFP
jgi:hypothetical protein